MARRASSAERIVKSCSLPGDDSSGALYWEFCRILRLSCAALFAMEAATDTSSRFFFRLGLLHASGIGTASGFISSDDGIGETGRLPGFLFLFTSLNIPTRMTPAIKRNFKKSSKVLHCYLVICQSYVLNLIQDNFSV